MLQNLSEKGRPVYLFICIIWASGLVPARAADVAEVEPEDDDEEEGVSLLSRRLCDGPIQVQPFFFVYVVYNLSESEAVELETVLGLQ